jgi:plastocyanin
MPEPKIWKITIEQGISGASFDPSSLTITLNDSVFWANNTANPHQPAPNDGTADQWVEQPIPPYGQSPQVVFDSDTPATNPYHCATHPQAATEKGVIIVNAEKGKA